MPPFGPVKRREPIACLQRFGFVGPFRGGITLIVPNPHRGDIAKNLLSRILRQAGISRDEWEAL